MLGALQSAFREPALLPKGGDALIILSWIGVSTLHHTVVKLTSRWRVKGRRRAAQISVFPALPCPAKLQPPTETYSFVARTEVSKEGKHDRSAIIGYGGASQTSQTQDCTLPPWPRHRYVPSQTNATQFGSVFTEMFVFEDLHVVF